MPSISEKQHNLMLAVAHNPTIARERGISQSVGKEFAEADAKNPSYKQTAKSRLKKREVKPHGHP